MGSEIQLYSDNSLCQRTGYYIESNTFGKISDVELLHLINYSYIF